MADGIAEDGRARMKEPAEWRKAFRIVWFVLSAIMLGALIAPWAFTPAQLASVIPPCEWKARYHRECLLCGMTTAFFRISQGEFAEAMRANRGSVPLYFVLACNEAVLLGSLGFRARRMRDRSNAD